jgi:SAM-dependent methyltransferase
MNKNLDTETVKSFGDEWARFDQSNLSSTEALRIFEDYFSIFPWEMLPKNATGFDVGCGTGRWARIMARRVGHLHCIDSSSALEVARRALIDQANVSFYCSSADDYTLLPDSQDFGYSLGVLHHVPDTASAIRSCVTMLKPGAPLLLYLFYDFDNRSNLFRLIWRFSDLLRRGICILPAKPKHLITDLFAALLYLPLARLAWLAELLGLGFHALPLAYYRNLSYYTMRTDSRDRFGTPLEQRFTRVKITEMMNAAGLRDISFSDRAPFWCAVGIKR